MSESLPKPREDTPLAAQKVIVEKITFLTILNRVFEKLFKLKANNTSIRQEAIAGLTTFLTMAYIIFANPNILSDAGMDHGAVFVATCLSAALGCFVMGFVANYPIAMAPGMGLAAFFSYTIVLDMGHRWETALGAVFISGILFTLFSLIKVRQWVINAIPLTMRKGIAAGIGLFLGLIGLQSAAILVPNSATTIGLGDVSSIPVLLGSISFILVIALAYRGVKSAVILSILIVTGLALLLGDVEYRGIFSLPPSIAPTFAKLDIAGAFEVGMISVIFAFLFVDMFDTSGTLVAVAQRGNLLGNKGQLPRSGRAMLADSTTTVAGSLMGASTCTSYIESATGVEAGGRTGLTAVVVGFLFLCCLFVAPLAGTIPSYATTGALLYVSILMLSGVSGLPWHDPTEIAPVVLTAIMTALTFSIADGIAIGFICYALIKALSGRRHELNPAIIILAILFIIKFAFI